MDATFERVITALRLRGCKVVVRNGESAARASCPIHRDIRPSLGVTRKSDRVLIHCFAGCRVGEIVAAIGLRMADLFDRTASRTAPTAEAIYPYCDVAGEIIAEKVRFFPKAFRWRRPDPAARKGWAWGRGARAVGLYRFPELLEAREVLLTEGERAVDVLRGHGFTATCPPDGAGSWAAEWGAELWRAGCERLIILADNDRPGLTHALRVAASCQGLLATTSGPVTALGEPWDAWPCGVATDGELEPLRVKLLRLPTVSGGDVVDWLQAGHSADDLRTLIQAAPFWSPEAVEEERRARKRSQTRERVRRLRERRKQIRRSSVVRVA